MCARSVALLRVAVCSGRSEALLFCFTLCFCRGCVHQVRCKVCWLVVRSPDDVMRYRCLCYDFWQHALVIVQRLPLQAAPHRGLGCWQVLPAAEVCGEDSYLPFTTYEEARSSVLTCMHSPWQHWKENVHIPRKCLLFSFDDASPTRVDEMLFSKAWCEWCLTHSQCQMTSDIV